MRFVIVLAVVLLVVAAVVSAEEDNKKDRSASKKDREHDKKDREHGSKKDREHGSKKDREHGKKHRSHKERAHKSGKSVSEREASLELRERQERTLSLPHNVAARARGLRSGRSDRDPEDAPPVDPTKMPKSCPLAGQVRACNTNCVFLTCDNYQSEKASWTDCLFKEHNGIVIPIATDCYFGSGTWSECFCHPGYVLDEKNGACIRLPDCGKGVVTPSTTTTTEGGVTV